MNVRRRFLRCLPWLSALSLLATPLMALDPSRSITQYGFRTIRSEDGLPQSSVASIAQTTDGYLWFATEEGLARFDGARITVFLKGKTIAGLLGASDGSLWIGTEAGVVIRYQGARVTTYSHRDGLTQAAARSIVEGHDGSIWMATSSGLNRFHDGKFTLFTTRDGLPSDQTTKICVARDGTLWIGTHTGLSHFANGRFTNFSKRDGLASDVVLAVREDHNGDLWAGTNDGLSRLHDGKFTTFSTADGLSNRSINTIREDRDGNLWIGTESGGLNRYSRGKFTSFAPADPLAEATVVSIFEDREGSIWFGTSGDGVNQLKPDKFATIGRSEGLTVDLIWNVQEGHDGSLLIGTNHGFAQWKDGRTRSLTVAEGLSSNVVRSVLEDRQGGIWLGTNDGLARYRNGKLTLYGESAGLPQSAIRMVAQDREGNIWIGARSGGLVRFADGIFTVLTTSDGLADNSVGSLNEDRDGSLWIGTDNGVSVLKNGHFTNYGRAEGLSAMPVRVVYHDRDGGHWVGTYGGGLNRIKDGRVTPITSKDGLFNDVVFSIVEDDMGYLWMTCNFGIYRVSRKELDDFADGRIASVHSSSFDAGDGMVAAECDGGFPASWKGKDGRLYFPTVKGIAVIDPNHVAFNALPPVVRNEEVLLDGKIVPTDGGLTVGPGRHNLEIHYTALTFIAPKEGAFRYRLKGFNDEWVDAGNRRTAFYTNVPPGNYTFEVTGSNNDGVWSRANNPLRLRFQAAFFQTTWFAVLSLLGLFLVIWAGLKIRLRMLKDHERQLVQRVEEQTAELTAARDAAETLAQINAVAGRTSALILNSVTDGIIGVDASGRPTFINPAASRIIGRTVPDFHGMTLHEAIHHSRADGTPFPQAECQGTIALGRRESIVTQDIYWRADGSSFPAEYSTIPVEDADSGTALVMTFRDVTERRAIERLKDEFVSTVSHELRTPLTSIRGALGLLKSGMLGTIEAKGQRMLEIAVINTDRLVRLINDILDVERIDSGKIELSSSLVDAYGLMTDAAEGVQSLALDAGVAIAIVPVGASLWIDADRIMQTLTNLLSNSIKFSPPGTIVTLSGEERDGVFTFRVADQGRGVPDDKLETIFERFKQVDASDSRDKGGSGLGLAICRSIVNAHRGTIWAERNGEKGTLFQFTLPSRPATAAPPEVRRRILLCQDDRPATATMSTILQDHGFDVASVSAADEVTARAAEVRPEAIILDVASNSGRGFEIVEALKAHAETRETPIVVIAGRGAWSGESHAAGIAGWVRRPFRSEDLLRAVEQACAGPAILVVEDDLDLARVMIASLQAHGFRTIHAATGREAIDRCGEQQPALIVLDLVLPELDGFAVVKALRASATLATVPLLVYSASEVGTAEQARLTLGPTDFLTKSRSSVQEFESRVVRLLQTVIAGEEGLDAA